MSVMVWFPMMYNIVEWHGLDPRLIMAIIEVESNGDPRAISEAGAVGLMQVMPQEAGEQFQGRPPKRWLLNPFTNVDVGCHLLARWLEYYRGDVERAVMAYYAGPGNVPREGEVTHEGARRYLSLVRGAYRRLFPMAKWPGAE